MKKGFTLVELLAVIVILAIILAIAVPGISSVIDGAKKGSFESDVKMIFTAMKYEGLTNSSFDPTSITEDNIENILNIDKSNYKNIMVTKEKGEPYIVIVGQNKWDNLVAIGTKNSIQTYKNLVLWLDAGNNMSYPGAGNVWYDLSGNENNCSWNVTPTYSVDGYFTFDGSSNYGTITNNPSLDFSDSQTLVMVLRHTYTSGRKNPWDQAYGGYGTWTHENGDNINQYFGNSGVNNSPYIGVNSTSTPRSVWNVLAATRGTKEYKWYINGVVKTTVSNPYDTLAYTAANIRIGTGYAGYWQGDMAAVLAFNRVLNQTEIQQIYEMFKKRFGL